MYETVGKKSQVQSKTETVGLAVGSIGVILLFLFIAFLEIQNRVNPPSVYEPVLGGISENTMKMFRTQDSKRSLQSRHSTQSLSMEQL